jgi:hypothetical protein
MKILDDALLDKINGGLSKEWQEELDEKIRTYKRINYTKERLVEPIRTDFAYVPCEDESLPDQIIAYIEENWDKN